jgi:ubiquitin-protein ligase E3 C
MLPTFTGRSRRPRNVNLSGQNINPFAATSWTPATAATGASQSVSLAQAERQQRQQERQRLKAVSSIQRTWRGHRARRELRESRRQAFDAIYKESPRTNAQDRVAKAFPLILSAFDPRCDNDVSRLHSFARDLSEIGLSAFFSQRGVHPSRLGRLTDILVIVLEKELNGRYDWRESGRDRSRKANVGIRSSQPANVEPLLRLIFRIGETAPQALSNSIWRYYKVLAQICENPSLPQEWTELVSTAMLTPLQSAQASRTLFYPQLQLVVSMVANMRRSPFVCGILRSICCLVAHETKCLHPRTKQHQVLCQGRPRHACVSHHQLLHW